MFHLIFFINFSEIFSNINELFPQSIARAHENKAPSNIYYSVGELSGDMNANINRSPYGYQANPQGEKDRYVLIYRKFSLFYVKRIFFVCLVY